MANKSNFLLCLRLGLGLDRLPRAEQTLALKHFDGTRLRTARGIAVYFEFARLSVFCVFLLTISVFCYDLAKPEFQYSFTPYLLAFAPSIAAVLVSGALKLAFLQKSFSLSNWVFYRKLHAIFGITCSLAACALFVVEAGEKNFAIVFAAACIQMPVKLGYVAFSRRFLYLAYFVVPGLFLGFLSIVAAEFGNFPIEPGMGDLFWLVIHGTTAAISATLAINWISTQASFVESKVILANADLEEEREGLRAEKEFSENIRNSLSEGVVIADHALSIIQMNPAFEVLFSGLSVGDKLPSHLAEFAGRTKLGSRSERSDLELEDGRILNVGCQPFWIKSDEIGYICTLLDVTEQRRIDEEIAKNEHLKALGVLASSVAHDFNNYLAIMRANTELLLKLDTVGTQNRHLQNILHSCESASIVTRQLLSTVRDLPEQIEIVDAADVLKAAARLLSHSDRYRVPISMDLEDGAYILIDALLLETMILNLVSNACDAVGSDGQVALSVRRYDGEVSLNVIDNGEGISADMIEKVTQPFFTTKRDGRGTGLGLSTVASFAKRHNGRLKLHSELGKGTTASLIFPAQDVTAEGGQMVESESDRSASDSCKVLVVEDNPELRLTLEELLRVLGHQVITASGTNEFNRIADSQLQDVDLVFCDILLDQEFGSEVLKAFRSKGHTAPFVFMSGNLPKHEEETILEIEPCQFLQKPLTLADLQKVFSKQTVREYA